MIPNEPGRWRIERVTIGAMTVNLDLVQLAAPLRALAPAASPGSPVSQADLLHGATELRLFGAPLDPGGAVAPILYAAAAGEEAGWRQAQLEASFDGGTSWVSAGSTAAPAVIGVAVGALAAAGSALADLTSILEVELLNESMWLESRSDQALAAGANLALVGDELIQFGAAEAIRANRFSLSRLWRGRRGTEWASTLHAPGEGFLLIEAASLAALDAPAGSAGSEARLAAEGIGDPPGGTIATRTITGEALRPPSPVHFRAVAAGGGLTFSWVRRSRLGFAWTDRIDAPLGEESERYLLRLSGAGFERSLTLDEPGYHYSAVDRAADGYGAVTASVSQLGTFSASRPAILTIS